MTCVVAKVEDGKIFMVADKCGSDGYTKILVDRPKVFINGGFIIGYTTSFRMGQLLEFTWSPPEQLSSQSDEVFIYKVVVESIKNTLKSDGFATDTSGGSFLFGYKGVLYEMQPDYAIFKIPSYSAVGCGSEEAKAVMYTLDQIGYEGSMEECLVLAVKASSVSKAGVSSEYDYLVLDK